MATEVVKVIDPDSGTGYDYESLYDWEAAQQGDLTGVRDEIAVAKCRCTGGTADTTKFTVDGWTTSATQYIKIWTDPSEEYRHSGTYPSGNKYRLQVTSDNNQAILIINESYVRILGIPVYNTRTTTGDAHNRGIEVNSGLAGLIIIGYCIVKKATEGPNYATGIRLSSKTYVYNTIVYDYFHSSFTHYGIDRAGGQYSRIYNCTVQNCGVGYKTADDGSNADQQCVIKNSIAQDCTDGFLADWAWGTGSNYNCSDIASDAIGANSQTGEVTFADEANDDFHLSSSDTVAIGNGLNLYNDADWPFQDDINGQDRGGSGEDWDIGMDEYVSLSLSIHVSECVGSEGIFI